MVIAGIILVGGNPIAYLDPASIFLVFGTTACAMLVAYSGKELSDMGKAVGKAFGKHVLDVQGGITAILDMANIARKEGILALEEKVKDMEDPFIQKCIQLIVDGADAELVKDIMESDIDAMSERHTNSASMLDTLANLGPAFGMLATVLGLIAMLANLDDPSTLGPGMSMALITTMYGSLIANAFAIPVAIKLKTRSSKEILYRHVMLEGMLSIQAGDNRRIIEEKLYSFLPPGDKPADLDGGG
jgi:chemotaxis protein MotA